MYSYDWNDLEPRSVPVPRNLEPELLGTVVLILVPEFLELDHQFWFWFPKKVWEPDCS